MKKLFLFFAVSLLTLSSFADNASDARKILDKTAAIVGRKGGAQASFTISGNKIGTQSGTIAIKGSKFCARTANATMWYDGKTQWTYMKSTNEVNVANPSPSRQQSMNPYTFISLYKNGYKLSVQKQNGTSVVTMKKAGASISECYVTIDSNHHPTKVRMLQGKNWITVSISNFQAKNQSDSQFSFNSKDYPTAEVVDLR